MIITVIVFIISISICYGATISNHRLRSNATSNETSLIISYIIGKNITMLYTFNDGKLNIPQDWNATLYSNTAINMTMPKTLNHWSFDYDFYSNVTDKSLSLKAPLTNAIYHPSQPAFFVNGIIHYVGFEQCSTTQCKDWSRNKVNASKPTQVTLNYSQCKKGSCINMRPAVATHGMLNISNKTVNKNLANFSVAVWIYPYRCTDCEIFNKERIGYAYLQLALTSTELIAYRSWTGGTVAEAHATVSNLNGSWQHVAATYKKDSTGGRWKLYLNGVSITTTSNQTGTGTQEDDHLGAYHIGNQPNALSFAPFNGSIDELYVFNKTLLPREVYQLYKDTSYSGYSYLFRNETERLTVPDTAGIKIRNCSSISAWIYPYTVTGTRKIIQKNWAGASAYALLVVNGEARFSITNGAGDSFSATCNGCIAPYRWYHLVGTTECDSSNRIKNVTLYVNSVLSPVKAINVYGHNFFTTTGYLSFGEIDSTRYVGILDDVKFFNKSLSQSQVKMVYDNSFYKTSNFRNATYSSKVVINNITSIISDTTATTSRLHIFNVSQYLTNMILDDCSVGTVKALVLRIYREDSPTSKLISRLQIAGTYGYNDAFTNYSVKTINYTRTGRWNYSFCLRNSKPVIANLYMQFNNKTVDPLNRWYFIEQNLSNITLNSALYNYNDTTGLSTFRGTVRDSATYLPKGGIVAQLQRYYLGEALWRTVQMDKSDDLSGQIFYRIIEQTIDYRIRFINMSNVIVKQTESAKFSCTSGFCDVTILLFPSVFSGVIVTPSVTGTFNNATGIVNISWEYSDGQNHRLHLLVSKNLFASQGSICDMTQLGQQGTFLCNVTGYYGEVKYALYASGSPELEIVTGWIQILLNDMTTLIPKREGAFWGFVIGGTLIMMGITTGAIGALITAVFALIVVKLLGITTIMTYVFISLCAVLAIVLGLVLRRNNG